MSPPTGFGWCARTGTAHRIFEAGFIRVVPDFKAGRRVVANDRLHRAALFLGEQQIAGDGLEEARADISAGSRDHDAHMA